MRLRYTGVIPTVFITGDVGEVEPGDEFNVPDDLSESFTRRPDVEIVTRIDSVTVVPVKKQDRAKVTPSSPEDETAAAQAAAQKG